MIDIIPNPRLLQAYAWGLNSRRWGRFLPPFDLKEGLAYLEGYEADTHPRRELPID